MLTMSTFVSPQIFLVSLLAGWLNQEQQKILEYLQEENRVLKAQLGQRLRLSDEQRRRLAAKGKELGRKLLAEVATLVTPDTILRWHRETLAAADFFTTEHLCRQARMTLAPSCRESDLGAFSSTTAVPRRLSPAAVAPRWARPT